MIRNAIIIFAVIATLFALAAIYSRFHEEPKMECFVSTGDPGHYCVEKK